MRGAGTRLLLICVVAASPLATTNPGATSAAQTVTADLIQIIDTSRFSPPSPDPAGLALLPSGDLLMSDSEVDEMPALFEGKNLFQVTTDGRLVGRFKTTRFSSEPAGLEVTETRLLVADDDRGRVFIARKGKDGKFGTRDDDVRSINTRLFGSRDPEGLALGGEFLFISDGKTATVYRLSPGPNGVLDGVAPQGDDRVRWFDAGSIGQPDPEGLEYDPASGTLFIVSNRRNSSISETTIRGRLVTTIDTAEIGLHSPSGLALAPASTDPSVYHLYIADRGVDNGADPKENDGRIFEIAF